MKKEAKVTISEVKTEAKLVMNLKEFCRVVRSLKPAALAAEVSGASPLFQLLAADDFLVAKRLLFSDPSTLTDMFQFIARKLHEVPRHFKNMTLPAMKALGPTIL